MQPFVAAATAADVAAAYIAFRIAASATFAAGIAAVVCCATAVAAAAVAVAVVSRRGPTWPFYIWLMFPCAVSFHLDLEFLYGA